MAGRFRFRLEAVLKVRRARENEQRRVVAERAAEVHRIDATLASLAAQMADANRELRRTRGAGTLDVASQLAAQRWRVLLERRVARGRARRAELAGLLEEARTELVRRAVQTKVLVKLRERLAAAHHAERSRLERLEADEMAVQSFVRQRAG